MYFRVQKEFNSLLLESHENIVRFQGVSCWSKWFAIIVDYAPFGSLHSLLQNDAVQTIPFKLRYRMAYEVTKAVAYLHNCGIDDRMVHGDLKPKNIVLNEDLHIRVVDFGASQIATKSNARATNDYDRFSEDFHEYTIKFAAPEKLDDPYLEGTTAMDIFRCGD